MPNAINKVVYAGNTLIDLTSDTVTADKLQSGITAHAANGEQITGTADFSGGVSADVIADEFNTSTAYSINDLVIYNGLLYKFTSDHSAGAWNESHASAIAVADEFMKKTGDTMTGVMSLKNSQMSRSATSLASPLRSHLLFTDINDDYIAWNECGQQTSGEVYLSFGAGRYKQNTTEFISTNIGMFVKKDGTKSIEFTGGNDANIWRNGLGASSGVWTTSIGGTGGTDSGWKSLTNSSVYTGTIYYRRIGYFVEVYLPRIVLISPRDSSAFTTLATIPSGYRPSKPASYCPVSCDTVDHRGVVYIETDGKIQFIAEKGLTWGTNTGILATLFYFRA